MSDSMWIIPAVFAAGAFVVIWRSIGVQRDTMRDYLRAEERGRVARDNLLEKFAEKAMNPQNLSVVEAHANERVRGVVEAERTRREVLRDGNSRMAEVAPDTGTAEEYFEGE